MSNNLTVKILEISGLGIAARYVGLPVGKIRSRDEALHGKTGNLTRESVSRLSRLISQGDEHAKIMRQVVVHMEITAPRYWWQQFACYHAGVEMHSASTMHTLLKSEPGLEDFTEQVSFHVCKAFKEIASSYGYVTITEAKANLPEGFLQTRLVMVSYQTLRRMWLQRRTHKLGEWHGFIEAMRELPHCHDLIFVEPRNPWRELWEQMPSPWYYDTEQNVESCIGCGSNREYGHDSDCVIAEAKALLEQSRESEQ